MAREFIEKQDTLNTGREKLNRSITRAYEADKNAGEALDISKEANQIATSANEKSDYTQTQLDTVTGASTIDPAVEQLKVGSDGQTYPSPDARLRSEYEKINSKVELLGLNIDSYSGGTQEGGDYTDALQSAIDDASDLGLPLFLNKEEYRITRDILIPSNLTVFLNEATIKMESSTFVIEEKENVFIGGGYLKGEPVDIFIRITDSKSIEINGLKTDGNLASAIRVNGADGLILKGLTIENANTNTEETSGVISISDSKNIRVLSLKVINGGAKGIAFRGTENITGDNIYIESVYGPASDGIYFNGCQNATISNSFSRDASSNALKISRGSENITISKCKLIQTESGVGNAFRIQGGKNCILEDSIIINERIGSVPAIIISAHPLIEDGNTINNELTNNTIMSSSQFGIRLASTSGKLTKSTRIIKNRFMFDIGATNGEAIFLDGPSTLDGILIADNVALQKLEIFVRMDNYEIIDLTIERNKVYDTMYFLRILGEITENIKVLNNEVNVTWQFYRNTTSVIGKDIIVSKNKVTGSGTFVFFHVPQKNVIVSQNIVEMDDAEVGISGNSDKIFTLNIMTNTFYNEPSSLKGIGTNLYL